MTAIANKVLLNRYAFGWCIAALTFLLGCARIALNLPPHQTVPYYERMPPGSGDDTALI